jgi:PAS domain S-box-containing protein
LLYAVGRELHAGRDIDAALRRVLGLVVPGLQAEDASLALTNEGGKLNRLLLYLDDVDTAPDRGGPDFWASLESSVIGSTLHSDKAILIRDTQAVPDWTPLPGSAIARSARSVLAAPLRAYDERVGVICLVHRNANVFDMRHQALLAAIGAQIAGAAHYDRLQVQVAQLQDGYMSLFEDSGVPIIITDLDGILIDLNARARQVAGWTKEELVGRSLNHSQLPGVLQGLRRLLPAARQNESVRQMIEIKSGDKDLKLDLYIRQSVYAGRAVLQWLMHDLTEQINLERARDEQIYMIVHDLRNPLGNIISSLELLHESIRDPNLTPAPLALVNIALRSSRRISLLIESLMDVTRMEGGQFALTTTTARLDTLIERAVDFIKPSADRKRIPLSVSIESNLPPVLIDVNMIERVVVNLLDNACKFVTSGQAVRVSARRTGTSEVTIAVQDNGPGIASEDRPRLFQKFSRGSGLTGQTPGTGLGLAFCKLAVEAHGGRINVESEPGKGSTFTFTLPVE